MLIPGEIARADGISGFAVIAVVYAILTIVGKFKEATRTAQRPPEAPRQAPIRPSLRTRMESAESSTAALPRRGGSTQIEARKLEELLRVLGQAPGGSSEGPMGRRGTPLPGAEEVEETESSEVAERVTDLETGVTRSERRLVDFDDDADKVIKDRLAAGAARDRSISKADHLEFDRRIRQAVADKTAVAKTNRNQLRQAIIWREILDAPLALRDPME